MIFAEVLSLPPLTPKYVSKKSGTPTGTVLREFKFDFFRKKGVHWKGRNCGERVNVLII